MLVCGLWPHCPSLLCPCWRSSPALSTTEVTCTALPVATAAQWSHLSLLPHLPRQALRGDATVRVCSAAPLHKGVLYGTTVLECALRHRCPSLRLHKAPPTVEPTASPAAHAIAAPAAPTAVGDAFGFARGGAPRARFRQKRHTPITSPHVLHSGRVFPGFPSSPGK